MRLTPSAVWRLGCERRDDVGEPDPLLEDRAHERHQQDDHGVHRRWRGPAGADREDGERVQHGDRSMLATDEKNAVHQLRGCERHVVVGDPPAVEPQDRQRRAAGEQLEDDQPQPRR